MSDEGAAREQVVRRLRELTTTWATEQAIQFQGAWWTWGDVAAVHRALDDALEGLGLGATPGLGLVLRQRPAMVAAELSGLASGRMVSLVSPLLGDRALAEDIARLAPTVLAIHRTDWQRPGIEVAVATAGAAALVLDDDGSVAVHPPAASPPSTDSTPATGAVTVLTSGTTGVPKRLPVAWSTFVATGGGAPGRPAVSGRGVMILSLPLSTLGGFASMARLVFGGRPMAMMERFSLHEWLALVREHRPVTIGAPPPVIQMILDADVPPDTFDGVTAYVTGSAAVPIDVARRFEERYGFPVLVSYGATEFLGAVTGWTTSLWEQFGPTKAGSSGRPMGGAHVRAVDPTTGEVVLPGEEGLLEVDPPRRAEGLPSGWLRTNDRGRIDNDGFVWVLGRADDVIVRGGFKVDLADVEHALRAHPAVADALAVGLPDPRLGSVPAALVVLHPDATAHPHDLIASTRDLLPAYGVPVEVRVVDALPRTSTMKPARAEAAAQFAPRRY